MFRLTFYCKDKKKIISSKLLDYFNTYPLKTNKKESLRNDPLILANVINKLPLSAGKLDEIRKLRHNMYYFTLVNRPTAKANKS